MANIFPSKLTITWFLIFFIFINQKSSSSARKLGSSTHHHDHYHNKITFFMQDVLNFNASSPKTTKLTSSTHHHLPFPKPLGLFPPNGGIPISESESSDPSSSVPATTQTLDVSNVGIFFPPRAALQELEFGTLVIIDEDLFEHYSSLHGSPRSLGKAQGVYVATSEDGTSHMMSMTASFSDTGFKDGLRFFGVHRKDGAESHIAVIGGTGKYDGANGYTTVKARVLSGSKVGAQEQEANKYLLFNVYLS